MFSKKAVTVHAVRLTTGDKLRAPGRLRQPLAETHIRVTWTPRNRRFESDDIEKKLIDAAGPHLRAVIIALLETACRPGEILSLQWKDVSLERNEIIVRAEKAKTRTARIVPAG